MKQVLSPARLGQIKVRTWVITGIAALLVAAVAVWWFVFAQPSSAEETTPTTRTVTASLETLEKSVEATGTLTPTVQEDVAFESSGTVTSVKVEAGETVKKGQTLATIDTLTVDADLLSAKADLASAEATLANSQSDSDGSDSALAQIDANAAAVEVAQTAVDSAQEAVEGAILTAPVAGLLTAVNLEVGDVVGSSSSSGSSASGTTGGSASGSTGSTGTSTTTTSTAEFSIVGTDSWEVSVSVDSSDIANIEKDDQVELTVDSTSAQIFGTVSEVGLLSDASSGTATYPVVIEITGSPEDLYDGVAVTAEIIYERRADVLTVSSSAISTNDAGESVVQLVGEDGTAVETVVETGETSDTLTEITSGLTEGDEVQVTVFQGGGGNSSDTGEFQMGEMPGGGELPEGFDPSQMTGGGGFGGGQAPGGTN